MNFNRIAGQESSVPPNSSPPSTDPRASSSNFEPMSDPYEEAAERRQEQEPELESA
jgi:hypothetical protein